MAKRSTRAGSRNGKKKAPAGAARKAKPAVTAAERPHADGVPDSLVLWAQVSGEVLIRLRVLDPAYTAKRLARLLNAGNATWEVGDPARYHRIVVGGRVVAQIEQADEDTRWGRYEAD